MFFGYMNSNWEEEFDVAVGPDNHIEPGGPDQGQPTHFYPRNMFLFTIRVPKDFGDKELVWTLVTHKKYRADLRGAETGYLLNKQTIATEVGANMAGLGDELLQNGLPCSASKATSEGARRSATADAHRSVKTMEYRVAHGRPGHRLAEPLPQLAEALGEIRREDA